MKAARFAGDHRDHDWRSLRTERAHGAGLAPFPGYRDARCSGVSKPVAKDNVKSMLEVIDLHRAAVRKFRDAEEFGYLKEEAGKVWDRAARSGQATRLSQRAGYGSCAHRHD